MNRAVHVIEEGGPATAALHPLRIEILAELADPDSAAGLARRIGIPRQQVNYHIRQLEEQGLVTLIGERRVRNCVERLVQAVGRSYVISPAVLGRLAANPRNMDENSPAHLMAIVSQTVQEIAKLQQEPDELNQDSRTVAIRSDIRFRSREARNEFAAELTEEVTRLVAKYHAPQASKGLHFRLLASAYPITADPKPKRTSRRSL